MVKNFNSCRTCGKHSHNLQKLSLDQFHTQQYDPHRVLQSITGKWIGLDGKCFGSLAVIFSAEGLPIYVAFYEESKFINGHYQAV